MSRAGRPVAVAAATAAAALSPAAARAHLVGVEFGDFYAGALHVLTGVGYLACLVALALLAGLQPRESGRWALVAAPPALLAGALAATLGPLALGAAPALDPAVTLALAAGGLLAALNVRPGAAGVGGFAALAGFAMGVANGQAATGEGAAGAVDPLLFALGVSAAGSAAVILGVALARATADRLPALALVWRVAGSWLAAAGVGALALLAAQAG